MRKVLRWLRDSFVSGLLVVLPLGLTLYILWLFYGLLRALLGPDTAFAQLLRATFGRYIPGTEVVLTLLAVAVVGAVARNWLGRRVVERLERVVLSLPGVRKVYWATRQLSHALLRREVAKGEFRRMMLVEFPKEGSYVLGFQTSDTLGRLDAALGMAAVSVYVPTAPNPLSGYVLVIPKEKVIPLDISVDEGLSFVLSGGMVVPQELRRGPGENPREVRDAHPAG
ncbi:MAG: DUF502 domain-containing protein [Candidatus Bipolaricaulaceae bacterium]